MDMLVCALALDLVLCCVLLWIVNSTAWLLAGCAVYFFLFYVLDDADASGARAWAMLRRARVWTRFTAVQYSWAARAEVSQCGSAVVFVVFGNHSNMGLISGFGLHGGAIDTARVVYMLPDALLAVPLMRECLMYTGAVSARRGKDRMGAILGFLRQNCSVAFAPGGMEIPSGGDGDGDQWSAPEDLLNFAMEHSVKLVPVLITGEARRYAFLRTHSSLQKWSKSTCGYPFPFGIFPRIFGPSPPPRLHVSIGTPMDPSIQGTAEEFSARFMNQIHAFREVFSH